MKITVTRHAQQRYAERVGDGADLSELVVGKRPQPKIPRWVSLGRTDNNLRLVGAIMLTRWRPHPKRQGWLREALVALPVARDGRDGVVTTVIVKNGQRERLA